MFLSILIDNFQGIKNEIKIDCKALPKKRVSDKILLIDNEVKVNKIVGIIGSNASGKSSIVNAMKYLTDFISQDSEIDKKRENFLKSQNEPNRITKIAIELFIPNGDGKGYYDYSLSYCNKGINEILKCKKKYNEKWKLIFDIKNDKFISDINFRWKFYKNIITHYNDDKKMYYKLTACKEFYNYYINNCLCIGSEDMNSEAISNIIFELGKIKILDKISEIANLVDKSIKRCAIENNEIVFYNFDNKMLKLDQISIGTQKFIILVLCIAIVLDDKGVLVIDEIENNMFYDILGYIYLIFKNESDIQLIFTTNNKFVFDIKDKYNEKYIDNDQIYELTKYKNNTISAIRNILRNDKVFSRSIELEDSIKDKFVYNMFKYMQEFHENQNDNNLK